MNERFLEWCPAGRSLSELSLRSLSDGPEGLILLLDVGDKRLRLEFGVVLAFRSTVEEACLEFWRRFHADGRRTGGLWVIRDSEWLGSFSEADLIHYRGAVHYLIVTSDERIDVLSSREPIATMENAP